MRSYWMEEFKIHLKMRFKLAWSVLRWKDFFPECVEPHESIHFDLSLKCLCTSHGWETLSI